MTDTPFTELGLSPLFSSKLEKAGFEQPTDIQAQAIPIVLNKQDMVARAPTGSGKSAAFLLPLLQLIWLDGQNVPTLEAGAPRALVLVPTRELAGQLWAMARNLQPPKTSPPLEITGGVPYPPQFRALERPQPVIIATPGRLCDLVKDNRIALESLELLVLDEADRMLEMGFTEDLDLVLERAPRECQKLLFSATMPRWVERASNRFLNEPAQVQVGDLQNAAPNIEQGVYFVPEQRKLKVLKDMLAEESLSKVIVFVNTKARADVLEQELRKADIRSVAIHGDHGQGQRRKALARFRNDEVRVLIGSDVAARGVDLPAVTHVVNYDMPREFETYVHRIGRTGRANTEGTAINLVDRFEASMVGLIQKKYDMRMVELGNELPPPSKKNKGEKRQDFKPKWNNRPDSRKAEDEREDRAYKTGFDPALGSADSPKQRARHWEKNDSDERRPATNRRKTDKPAGKQTGDRRDDETRKPFNKSGGKTAGKPVGKSGSKPKRQGSVEAIRGGEARPIEGGRNRHDDRQRVERPRDDRPRDDRRGDSRRSDGRRGDRNYDERPQRRSAPRHDQDVASNFEPAFAEQKPKRSKPPRREMEGPRRPAQTERSDRANRAERRERPENQDRSRHQERPKNQDRAGKPDRKERPAKSPAAGSADVRPKRTRAQRGKTDGSKRPAGNSYIDRALNAAFGPENDEG